jgi:hypothetical protein
MFSSVYRLCSSAVPQYQYSYEFESLYLLFSYVEERKCSLLKIKKTGKCSLTHTFIVSRSPLSDASGDQTNDKLCYVI